MQGIVSEGGVAAGFGLKPRYHECTGSALRTHKHATKGLSARNSHAGLSRGSTGDEQG